MLISHISSINDSGSSHDPVGNSSEVFNEIERTAHLVVKGAGWVRNKLRGIDRKRDVIILMKL